MKQQLDNIGLTEAQMSDVLNILKEYEEVVSDLIAVIQDTAIDLIHTDREVLERARRLLDNYTEVMVE